MIIETLILCAFSAIIAYLVGHLSASTVYTKFKGWEIRAWKGNNVDGYVVMATCDNTTTTLILKPDGTIDFDYWNNKKYGEQR